MGAQGPLSGARYALLGRAKRPEVDYDMLRDRRGVAQGPLRTRHILEALSNRAPSAVPEQSPSLRSLSNLPLCGP